MFKNSEILIWILFIIVVLYILLIHLIVELKEVLLCSFGICSSYIQKLSINCWDSVSFVLLGCCLTYPLLLCKDFNMAAHGINCDIVLLGICNDLYWYCNQFYWWVVAQEHPAYSRKYKQRKQSLFYLIFYWATSVTLPIISRMVSQSSIYQYLVYFLGGK